MCQLASQFGFVALKFVRLHSIAQTSESIGQMAKQGRHPSEEAVSEHETVYRILRLMGLMRRAPRRSAEEYSELIGVSKRTIYRYFGTLKELGFMVESDEERHFFIAGEELRDPFTFQEAALLMNALEAVAPHHDLAWSIRRKLNLYSEQTEVLDALIQANKDQIITRIADAIFQRKRVRLIGYHSANSNTTSDRLVEPIEFVSNLMCLAAYEVETGMNKYFRLDRISSVELLDAPIKHRREHQAAFPDMFGFALQDDESGIALLRLNLSLKATLFIRSEYPLSIPYLTHAAEPDRYLLTGPIADLRPAVRFIRGFDDPNDIWVLGDESLVRELANSSHSRSSNDADEHQ